MIEQEAELAAEEQPSIAALLLQIKDDALDVAKAELLLLEAEAGSRTDALRRGAITAIACLVVSLSAVVALTYSAILAVGQALGRNWPLAALLVGGTLALISIALFWLVSRDFKSALGKRKRPEVHPHD